MALFLFRSLMPKGGSGMEQQKPFYQPPHLPPNLHVKLDPRNFLWITPALASVVGYVLGVDYGRGAVATDHRGGRRAVSHPLRGVSWDGDADWRGVRFARR